jgi:hypothetical protein
MPCPANELGAIAPFVAVLNLKAETNICSGMVREGPAGCRRYKITMPTLPRLRNIQHVGACGTG